MEFKFVSKKDVSLLPEETGIYAFKNNKGLLYIGKAINIRERVKNHFNQPSYKDNAFIEQVGKIGYIKTDSEIEALIFEANLIKKYKPKYNTVWKDDKNYFYVALTKEDFPKVFITHQQKVKADFIGPFVDGNAIKQTLKILRKVFPFRSCNRILKHPCLWYHIKRCPAPCLLNSSFPKETDKIKRESQNNAKSLKKILEGKKSQTLKDLKKEMKRCSDSKDYERAAKARDKIEAVEKVIRNARILDQKIQENDSWAETEKIIKSIFGTEKQISRIEAFDISDIQGKTAVGSMVVFDKGLPDKSSYRKFKIKTQEEPNDTLMLKEIISRRMKHEEWPLPDLILIDGGKPQLSAARSAISSKRIPLAALAKKKEELYIETRNKPLLARKLPRSIFNLMLSLRDEAHRFAISYHHKLRRQLLIKR